jgi:hypothetical protein
MEKKLTQDEYEKRLLEIEADKTSDPLDVHAGLFKYYNPRFQGQLNYMSKKQILNLATSLAGSKNNAQSDVNKIITMSKDIGLNALRKIVAGTIEHPLAKVDLTLPIEKEAKLFVLFDSLLTNKYYTCIKNGLEEQKLNPERKIELEDFITHSIDLNSREFKKREKVEKDGFFTGNKLLCSKTIMWLVIQNEYLAKQTQSMVELNHSNNEVNEKEEKNG